LELATPVYQTMELAGEKDSSDIGDGSSGDDGACGCCGDAEAGWQQPRVGFAASGSGGAR